jgi:hypothetical protein
VHFKAFIEEKCGLPVVVGTHPIPEKCYPTHAQLGTWKAEEWQSLLEPALCDEPTRLAYD